MSNFPTPLEEVIHHNVIKNNRTGGPALDVGQMKLLWRALGENTGYTFSIFESTLAPGMGIPLHRHPFPEFSMYWKALWQLGIGTTGVSLSGARVKAGRV